MKEPISIFWFRRDLRLDDNVGFWNALKGEYPVMPLFIFDTEILDSLPEDDARVTFIYDRLQQMRQQLQDEHDSSIALLHGEPLQLIKDLCSEYRVAEVYTNHDYEPYATKRDREIRDFLEAKDIAFHTFKDQVIFEK
ncbi:MAG: deoxyribodipyrimidine photo-lyase, partial [Flavobacteriaceae bacterium]|nr:deoxyribodipyrimidine photo-lyase [Flavobacteriaceae bacterium]